MNNWETIIGCVILASAIIGGMVGIGIAIGTHARKKKSNSIPSVPTSPVIPPIPPVCQASGVAMRTVNPNVSNANPPMGQQVVVLYSALVNKRNRECPSCGCETSVDGAKCYVCAERR